MTKAAQTVLLSCTAVLLLSWPACVEQPNDPPSGTSDVATTAADAPHAPAFMPSFELRDLQGRRVSSSRFKGKVLMVDFWASWCAPCVKEMPHFQALYEKYQKKGLEIIGITLDVEPADVRKVMDETGARYTILFADEEGRIQEAFGVEGIPTTFLIDRKGRIREKIVGFAYQEEFEEILEGLLTPKSP